MPWHPALNQLRDALADLYAREADARRVVSTGGLANSFISYYPASINIWQSILEEANEYGRTTQDGKAGSKATWFMANVVLSNTYWQKRGMASDATSNYATLGEPPGAEPHVRWCERGRWRTTPCSISATSAPAI